MSQNQRTVLVIDDSPEDRELYRRYLLRDREYHYTILEAESGQEGLELWQRHQPDVVLLDYRLPDFDGLEWLAQIPTQRQQPCLPVIVVTGQGDEAIAVQAIKAGAQDYLIKGQITPDSLHLAVNGAIETVQLRTQLQQRLERERLVAQITRLLHQSLLLDEILQTTVTEVRRFLQTDRVLIFRLQSNGWGIVTAESVGSQWTPLLSTSLYDPCFNENYIEPFRQGLVTVKPDIYDGSIDPCHVELLAQLQVRANLVVPIVQDNQLWGMLIAHHCAAPRQWQPLEIDLLKELATQAGIAIQQAELYQQVKSELAQRQQAESALQIAFAQLEERATALAASNEELQAAMEELEVAEEELRTQNEELAIAQTQIEQQRQRYQALFEFAPDGYLVTDEQGVIQEANSTSAALLQMSLEQLIGKPLNAFIPSKDRQAFHDRLHQWLSADRFAIPRQTWELNFQPWIGQAFPVEVSLAQEVEASQCLRWLIRDITDRKQAELSLRESEERLRLGMQVTGFGLAKFDYTSNTVELSPEAAALYGLPSHESVVPRERLHATFHPEERAILAQMIQQVLDPAGSGWFARDHRVVWENGEVRWLTVRKQVFFDRSGEVPRHTHAILVALDITERKQAELERERLLQQEQVARAEAERASRVKDEFLAILSHELRSPLNPILGWVKLLQTRKFDAAKTAEALATIERNVKLQAQLIDDLLDVARILRGKLALNASPVNLIFIVESAIETVKTAAIAKSISIHPVLPQIGQVSGDPMRLQQIVWNLLSNAIKFTPKGGRVSIHLERMDDQAQITVTDTGIGISPDFLPHIFEYFRQEDASITRQYGGLGLGLAIVRSLVEAHGGTISAASPGEGQGATFTVRLPLLLSVERMSDRADDARDGELDLTGIRVLLVDDEPDTRELLAFMLKEYEVEVMAVASAAEVLALLESFQPDILVSDIGMPQMDGYTLLRQLRSLPPERGGQIPALALTAYARVEDRQQALSAGFQGHISKPVEPIQLVAAISDLLNRR